MARIVINGAGIAGLTTALLLNGDGHEVTVLERDAVPPPAIVEEAWSNWERRGVNQFRLLHFFLPRFRATLEAELPDVAKALDDAGALRINPVESAPEQITGGWRDGDERFESITGRRPVVEAAIAGVVADASGITVRRGVAVEGLVADGGIHVSGVRLAGGEEVGGDFVVDAMGRRSVLPAWLEAIGARRPIEQIDDSGFVYFGRHFRSSDDSLPAALGGPLQEYGSISVLSLPADHGTWGLGLIASNKDAAMRGLKDDDRWMAVAKSLPTTAHWVEGEPLEEHVVVMTKIEDRHRQFVIDGQPVATGVFAVGDSWACTNPSVGRGASIAALHSVAFRDLLREGIEDPVALARRWDQVTTETVDRHFQGTLRFDRLRLQAIDAFIHGTDQPADVEWEFIQAMQMASTQDPDCFRAMLDVAGLYKTGEETLSDPSLVEKIVALGAGWRDQEPFGPSRAELVALAGAG